MKLTKFNPVLEVEENLVGTDYVVGDIHGMYSLLMQELINIGFDSRKDRLFSVGDLVDRGPENKEVIELLKEDWFFAVCGNHEQMCIENVYHSHEYPELYRRHASNGGVWFCLEEFHKQKQIADIFSCLPVIIELKVDNLKIGIIHADVGDNWRLLKRNLKSIVGRKVLNHEDFHKSLSLFLPILLYFLQEEKQLLYTEQLFCPILKPPFPFLRSILQLKALRIFLKSRKSVPQRAE